MLMPNGMAKSKRLTNIGHIALVQLNKFAVLAPRIVVTQSTASVNKIANLSVYALVQSVPGLGWRNPVKAA